MHVTILLASYQGARFLAEQLASIAAQDHADWSLIVSDDGSRDATRAIVAQFAASRADGQVRLIDGPGQGATRNFLSLIAAAPQAGLTAMADQDDVWLPHKLTRAVAALDGTAADDPALYCARTILCDDALGNRRDSRWFRRPHAFRNALVQACTPGNTIVLTPAAVARLQVAAPAAVAAGVVSHDWWAYQVITGGGGPVVWDSERVLLYRQHGGNEVGGNDTLRGRGQRIGKLLGGDYGRWLRANLTALAAPEVGLTAENRDLAEGLLRALDLNGPRAAAAIRELGLYRQGAAGTAALYLAALAGRLRG